jgi:hypothetical protein
MKWCESAILFNCIHYFKTGLKCGSCHFFGCLVLFFCLSWPDLIM